MLSSIRVCLRSVSWNDLNKINLNVNAIKCFAKNIKNTNFCAWGTLLTYISYHHTTIQLEIKDTTARETKFICEINKLNALYINISY